MFGFFSSSRRIAALEKVVAELTERLEVHSKIIDSNAEDILRIDQRVERQEIEMDERIEREVESEVDRQLDGLEISISRR